MERTGWIQDGQVIREDGVIGLDRAIEFELNTSRKDLFAIDLVEGLAQRAFDFRDDWQDIKAVGISTFWHNIMGVDPAGRPSTALFSWADERSAPAARLLRDRLDERAVHRRTGCRFHPSYPAARLLWLRGARPDAWRATRPDPTKSLTRA